MAELCALGVKACPAAEAAQQEPHASPAPTARAYDPRTGTSSTPGGEREEPERERQTTEPTKPQRAERHRRRG